LAQAFLFAVSTRTYFREYIVLIYGTSLINYFCCFDALPHEGTILTLVGRYSSR